MEIVQDQIFHKITQIAAFNSCGFQPLHTRTQHQSIFFVIVKMICTEAETI